MRHFELTDLAAANIEQLTADGCKLSAQDILTIQRLSIAAAGERILARGKPSCAGGVWFYPLTEGASDWFARVSQFAAIQKSEAMQLFAFAYAAAHSRAGIEDKNERETLRDILRWRRRLDCTLAELSEALADINDEYYLRGAEAVRIGDETYNPDEITLMLCALVGGEPEVWRWQISIPAAADLIARRLALCIGDKTEPKKAAAIQGAKALAEFCAEIRNRSADDGSN